jgi:hypothetical protein
MREIILGDSTTVVELAAALDVSTSAVVATAFKKLGLMVTIDEALSFERARMIASVFGRTARKRGPE